MSRACESADPPPRRIPAAHAHRRFTDLATGRVVVVATLLLIVLIGGWLRLSGANWDSGQHLHPDERYMTQVATTIRWPGSIGEYLDVHTSPLSPYNTETGKHYVYGQLPLFGVKLVATVFGKDDYDHLNLVGRRLSAVIDIGSIVLVFLLARMVFARMRAAAVGALIAAALYAFAVCAMQAAHFFTVESWLVFFGLLTLVLAARALTTAAAGSPGRFRPIHLLVGASLGLALACKVSGALVAVPILIAILGEAGLAARRVSLIDASLRAGSGVLTILVAGYVAFRGISPYTFASSNWLDLRISSAYRAALTEQQDLLSGKTLIPPSYQWLLSPRISDPLKNLVLWQLGVALGVAAIVGVVLMVVSVVRSVAPLRRSEIRRALQADRLVELTLLAMVSSFVLLVFFYFGSNFEHFGRYLLPLVPLAAVTAAYGLLAMGRTRVAMPVALVVVGATGLYALAYHHIYTVKTTRVVATNWIVSHVTAGSTVANENWDDSLPLGSNAARRYKGVTVPVFDADDDTKLRKLYDGLARSDYYFLSSPRAWRTTGRLPRRFPIMSRYYKALFGGRLGFERVARYSSEPELLGVHLDDIGAEEAFSVYDHPRVLIYRKMHTLRWSSFRSVLCSPAPAPPGCG